MDHRRLAEWALYRNVDWGASETLVEKVHSLLPGHWMQLTTVGPRRRPALLSWRRRSIPRSTRISPDVRSEITAEIELLALTAVRDRR